MIAAQSFPLASAIADATRNATGPTTRVRLHGTGTEPQIRAALTRVWRLVGQPITVLIPMHSDPVGDVAAAWAAEHALHGIRVEHRVSEFGPPCVVVPADEPVPWCGCVHPPCGRCLDEPVRCAGRESPLCATHGKLR